MARYLAEQAELGVLQVEDADVAAQVFFQLMFGHFHQLLLFGLPVELTAPAKAKHIERVLSDFLKIYGNAVQPRAEATRR